MNILSVNLSEIMVTVGGQPCVIDTDLVTTTVSSLVTNEIIYLVPLSHIMVRHSLALHLTL